MDKLTGMEKFKEIFPNNHIEFGVLDTIDISDIKSF